MVEWVFTPCGDNATYVTITNFGFKGDGDSIVKKALDSTGGFTTVLDGAKAWLEHGIKLNLIADKSPKGLTEQ
jgi:predicted RNA-binding protein with TRAM domain